MDCNEPHENLRKPEFEIITGNRPGINKHHARLVNVGFKSQKKNESGGYKPRENFTKLNFWRAS